MRVKILTSPPLPPLRAWFPIPPGDASTPTISSLKSLLCGSISAFRGISSSSLRLSIDDFELLDESELAIVRDGDLICVNVLPEDATPRQSSPRATQKRSEAAASLKRKRRASTSSSSSVDSDTTTTSSESESETSSSESTSDSEDSRPTTPSLQKAETQKTRVEERPQRTLSPQLERRAVQVTFVPPGYGKSQTRSRNLRRRLKRMHEREDAESGPVSGANATVPVDETIANEEVQTVPQLMSLSLRNKNKAKNFKSFMRKPLPPKIIFGDDTPDAVIAPEPMSKTPLPCLIPPSSRSSLPPNLFVTSVDVEADSRRNKKRKMRDEYGDEEPTILLDYGPAETEVDVDKLESIANRRWDELEKPTSERVRPGMTVGYKALGIDPGTYTPEMLLTLVRVLSCGGSGLTVSPLRVREQAVDDVIEAHTWVDIGNGDWRIIVAD